MGCSQSKIENEESISRCKERKQFMKEAVAARNGFAAAHSSYAMSLKNTGAALSDYAQVSVEHPHMGPVQPQPPPVLTAAVPSYDNLPPPPPLPNFPAPPIQRAASMPEMKVSKPEVRPVSTIMEEEEEDENEIDNDVSGGGLRRRRSSKGSRSGKREVLEQEDTLPPRASPSPSPTPPPSDTQYTNVPFDYFFNIENIPGPSLSDVGEVDINKEEIERKRFDEKPKRVDGGDDVEERGSGKEKAEAVVTETVAEAPLPAVTAGKSSFKKTKQVGSAAGVAEGKMMVKGGVSLLQIFLALDDHFLKASASAHEVSKMLEATRLHYHSNFADNRGHIDHSARVMRVITWNRSFRGLPNVSNGRDDFDAEEQETHATVLDKLLAWEKKLYDEVKAGELMKFVYQKKVATLNKLKDRGSNPEALEKIKATVSQLHTRYIVDMQSMDSTVAEISRLRDEQLYPKLVQLVDGMATMWQTMQVYHEKQLNIVASLKYLDLSQSNKQTTEHHHDRTRQLCGIVQDWHLQFGKLNGYQKYYITALNNWLKLNLIPIESTMKEKVSSPPRPQNPPIKRLLIAWQDYLEKLPAESLKTAIFTFAAVIEAIMHHEEEEMNLKSKCEETRKELARKTRHFEDWYNKYMQRKIPDELDPERGEENAHKDDIVAEKQFTVEIVKRRLEEEEEAYERHCVHVREKSLASLKTHLPELFRALSDFALESTEMYGNLRSISQVQQNPRARPA